MQNNQMTHKRNSFVFYASFLDAVNTITDKELKLTALETILNYAFNDTLPTTDNVIINALFSIEKDQIDKCIRKYERDVANGKKGGAPLGNKNACKKKCCDNKNTKSCENNSNTKNNPKQPPKFRLNTSENEFFKNNQNNLINDYDYDEDYDKDYDECVYNSKTTQNNLNNNTHDNCFYTLTHDIYEKLKSHLPNMCTTYKPITYKQNINFDLLINTIKESSFLLECESINIYWCIKHYKAIISGKYKDYEKIAEYKKTKEPETYGLNLSREEIDNLFDDIDNISF